MAAMNIPDDIIVSTREVMPHLENWRQDHGPWYKMIANKKAIAAGTAPPHPDIKISPEDPFLGCYVVPKPRSEGPGWRAVRYWIQQGVSDIILCRLGDEFIPPAAKEQGQQAWLPLWRWACQNPISHEEYTFLRKNGHLPNEHPAAVADRQQQAPSTQNSPPASTQAQEAQPATSAAPAPVQEASSQSNHASAHSATTIANVGAAPPAAGDNLPKVENPFEDIKLRLGALVISAEALIKKGIAADQETADQAADLANTLGEIEKKSNDTRKKEKEPHKLAGEAVDDKWRDTIKKSGDFKAKLKSDVIDPFLTAKKKKLEAERAKAIQSGANPQELPTTRVSAGSGVTRAVSQQEVWTAEITDRPAFLAHCKDHPLVVQALETIAANYAKLKNPEAPPGVKFHQGSRSV